MKKSPLNYFAIFFLLLFSANSYGDATEAFMNVSATVEPSCTVTVSNLNFGPYNFAVSNETATVAILCTNGTKFRIDMGNGNAKGASEVTRSMSNNANYLTYSLYKDAGMSNAWGTGNTAGISGISTGVMQYFKVYGRIAENQNLPAGLYRDNVAVSLSIDGLSGFGYQISVGMDIAALIKP